MAGAEGSYGIVVGQEVVAAGGKSNPQLGTPAGGGQGLGSAASKATEQQHQNNAEPDRADHAAKMKAKDGDAEASDLGPAIPGGKLDGENEKQGHTEQADERAADGSRKGATIMGLP